MTARATPKAPSKMLAQVSIPLIYEYERVTEGEVGIRAWKREVTGTKTKAFRNWIRRSYVPISKLNAVDAAKRRQGKN
jgi:hypothetical protein